MIIFKINIHILYIHYLNIIFLTYSKISPQVPKLDKLEGACVYVIPVTVKRV